LKAKKVAIIREVSNDYSVGLAKFFVDEFVKLTGDPSSIVATSDYNTGDQDFTAQLTNIKKFEPDAIFAPGNYTESALIIKQARALGINAQFIGGDTWDMAAFLEVGGPAVEGAVVSTFFANDVPINKTSEAFLKSFRDEYKKEPSAVAASATTPTSSSSTRSSAPTRPTRRRSATRLRRPRTSKARPARSPSMPSAMPTRPPCSRR
jgi:amino acid/amide ABC transporter substrate-binding protein, HAAT family (TC 3.A.1.4.-)